MKPTAYNLTRKEIHYRHDAFSDGLRAVGFEVKDADHSTVAPARPGDVMLIWNRYWAYHTAALKFEQQGGTVIVAENGYVGPGGVSPHDMAHRSIFALALHGHNGSGEWPNGGAERWDALGVDLQSWRAPNKGHILVCPNRTFGAPNIAMPPEWPGDVQRRLSLVTKREIRVRLHPGNGLPSRPLSADLAGAHAVVIWASSVGVQALIAGVPVVSESPHWICKSAAAGNVREIESAWRADRLPAFHRLAWAQWDIDAIESGEAFYRLLGGSEGLGEPPAPENGTCARLQRSAWGLLAGGRL